MSTDTLPDDYSIADDFDFWTEDIAPSNRRISPFVYYGGKAPLARYIVPLLPMGEVYVEPFCGAASIFWNLPRPYPIEVLNDIDERVVNVFRVLQDREKFREFAHKVYWTPYSFAEYKRAFRALNSDDDVERAWAFYTVINQSFSGRANRSMSGWSKSFAGSNGGAPNRVYRRMKLLRQWHDRLMRVQIDNRDALEIIDYWDSPETVFYIDPPYPASTRTKEDVYMFEQPDEFHVKLIDKCLQLSGQALVSSYTNPIYERLVEAGWEKVEIKTVALAAARTRLTGIQGEGASLERVPRVEALYIKRKKHHQLPLFSE